MSTSSSSCAALPKFPRRPIGARWSARARDGTNTRSRPSSSHEFLQNGAQAVAYPSIVAGGPNACVLHYRDNNRQVQDGELLLIDAGCEFHGYASDITRTFPVNGKFTGPQQEIYELVLAAQEACSRVLKPGCGFSRLPRCRRARAGARLHRSRTVQRIARRGARDRAASSSSICTARATGSGSTCTMRASTR